MSLSRAFLYAGAGATIATLWDVLDASGPLFADVLYRELGAGRSIGAATAVARRELRRLGAPPRVWAAYALTGNPSAAVGVTARRDPKEVMAGVAFGLAVALLVVTAVGRFSSAGARLSWLRPAFAAAGLMVVAASLQLWPGRQARWNNSLPVARAASDTALALTPTVVGTRLHWSKVAGADEHWVEVYDHEGVPLGSTAAAAPPFALPAASGWIRVEARRHGRSLSRSALLPLPGGPRPDLSPP